MIDDYQWFRESTEEEVSEENAVCAVQAADQDAVEARTGEVLDLLQKAHATLRPDPLQQSWLIMAIIRVLEETGLADKEHFLAHIRAEKLDDLETQLRNLRTQQMMASRPKIILPGQRPS